MHSLYNQSKPLQSQHSERPLKIPSRVYDEVTFKLVGKESTTRLANENYISQRFQQQHGANINAFLPYFISLSENGELGASLGLQPAIEGTLFLEPYLNCPVEQAISSAFARPVSRDKIIEIGNLVATRNGSSYLLFAAMTQVLHEAGFQWFIFTATEQVKRIIQKLRFNPIELCTADANRLKNKEIWGSYYDNNPRVMAGDINGAYQLLMDSPILLQLLSPHKHLLKHISEQLIEVQHD